MEIVTTYKWLFWAEMAVQATFGIDVHITSLLFFAFFCCLSKYMASCVTWKVLLLELITANCCQVIAVAYAIMTTRSGNLDWKMRAARVFPMFGLPILSMLIYSTLVSFTRMRKYLKLYTQMKLIFNLLI